MQFLRPFNWFFLNRHPSPFSIPKFMIEIVFFSWPKSTYDVSWNDENKILLYYHKIIINNCESIPKLGDEHSILSPCFHGQWNIDSVLMIDTGPFCKWAQNRGQRNSIYFKNLNFGPVPTSSLSLFWHDVNN